MGGDTDGAELFGDADEISEHQMLIEKLGEFANTPLGAAARQSPCRRGRRAAALSRSQFAADALHAGALAVPLLRLGMSENATAFCR
jgi:hypothetical protein